MIYVHRTREPQILRESGSRWLTELQVALDELQRLQNDPEAIAHVKKQAKIKVEKAQQKYCHPKIKTALVQMFHGKCAYCESRITDVTYGHIEHFYPKGNRLYMAKTFEWANLLLACDICNNPRHKGTKFPLDTNGAPLLINPTDNNPVSHLKFLWDGRSGLACIYGLDARGREVEKVFDLNGVNGRKELIKARSEYVKKLMVILKYAQQGDTEAIAILRDSCKPDAEYSAFALTYIMPHLH
jgi:uncharacterized protein (TIGR02646 family)